MQIRKLTFHQGVEYLEKAMITGSVTNVIASHGIEAPYHCLCDILHNRASTLAQYSTFSRSNNADGGMLTSKSVEQSLHGTSIDCRRLMLIKNSMSSKQLNIGTSWINLLGIDIIRANPSGSFFIFTEPTLLPLYVLILNNLPKDTFKDFKCVIAPFKYKDNFKRINNDKAFKQILFDYGLYKPKLIKICGTGYLIEAVGGINHTLQLPLTKIFKKVEDANEKTPQQKIQSKPY